MASTAAASLARISTNLSFCCPFFGLPVESPVAVAFWLPVEAIFTIPVEMAFWLPVEAVFTDLACLAGGAFSFTCAMVSLAVVSLA